MDNICKFVPDSIKGELFVDDGDIEIERCSPDWPHGSIVIEVHLWPAT